MTRHSPKINLNVLQTLLLLLLLSPPLFAKGAVQKLGDVLAISIPISAYATTLYLGDKEGQYQFYRSYGAAMVTTMALKYTVREKRPDSPARDSFPSGHTSSAFAGAAFIHRRYGFEYALLPYLGALFTGYSRVHAHRHHTRDVVAGALIGMAAGWFLVDPRRSLSVTPVYDSRRRGIQVKYHW